MSTEFEQHTSNPFFLTSEVSGFPIYFCTYTSVLCLLEGQRPTKSRLTLIL